MGTTCTRRNSQKLPLDLATTSRLERYEHEQDLTQDLEDFQNVEFVSATMPGPTKINENIQGSWSWSDQTVRILTKASSAYSRSRGLTITRSRGGPWSRSGRRCVQEQHTHKMLQNKSS